MASAEPSPHQHWRREIRVIAGSLCASLVRSPDLSLFRYVERRVRDHAHDRSVVGWQTDLATADRGGRQNLNGSSDLGSGRVGLNVRDLDVRICLTEAATRPPTHHAATHVGPREYELDILDGLEAGPSDGPRQRAA